MEMPEMLQGESLKRLLQGAAVGAVVVMFVGFKFFDWTLASTASQMAQDQSKVAVVAALAPLCVQRFQQSTDASTNLVAMNKVDSWRRGSFIQDGGWATFPGQPTSNSDLADSCAKLLSIPKA
jgi:hypothetical protein